jgi:DeoR/GlpR family transcriptional regulator of sugar metabolism
MTKEERFNGILAMLQKEAMNVRQIHYEVGLSLRTIESYILEMRQQKLIYVEYYVRQSGSPSPYYRAGNKLCAVPPPPLSKKEYAKRHKERKENGQLSVRSSPSPVDNQHLITGCITSMVRNANMNPAIKLTD